MAGLVLGFLKIIEQIFCAGSKQDGQQHQQQQQQHNQQQGGSYAQHTGQSAAYPPQPQPTYPGQQHHGQQQGGTWGGAGGHHQQQQQPHYNNNNQQHHNNSQQHRPQGQSHGGQSGYKYEGKHTGGMIGSQPHGQYQNENQINQTNAHYTELRSQARKLGDQAHSCFARSQAAYQRGDGEEARELSVEGKRLMSEKDRVDDQAEEWIYRENNLDSPPGTIDLHGLYVKEAIEKVDEALNQAKRNDEDELRIIVGKGIHSQGHVAKIKPAVEDMMIKYNLSAHVDPHNTGVLIVDLKGREGAGRSRDAGTVVDELGGKGQECVIM